ncbi:MAG: hypothetical protein ACRDF0_05925 [Candidatus Limnocylindria bacterium]
MRRVPIALAVTLVALAVVLAAVLLRPPGDVAAPSPSPSPTATTSPTAPAFPSPSPTPQGLYMSKKLGFALDLPPPWHKAICGNIDPVEDGLTGDTTTIEQFTSVDAMTEFLGHVGFPEHRVVVQVRDNPRGLSPMEFTSGRNPIGEGVGFGTGLRSTTLAGRPAAEFGDAGGPVYGYMVGEGDRMYIVHYVTARFEPAPEPAAAMTRIVRSFRFLSASERQALPDPTPIPAAAPTVQALAGMLKTAFEAKDVAALERLLGPCVNVGAQSAGASSLTRERYISHLRAQFAAGLTVTVDASAIRTEEGFRGTTVRSRWNAVPAGELATPPTPGPRAYDVELVLGKTAGGFFWRGTLVTYAPPG